MSTFLDRETILHKNVDKTIYSDKLHYPDRNKFINLISSYLGDEVYPSDGLVKTFNSIRPDFDRIILDERMKEYALDYVAKLKMARKRLNKFNKRHCPVRSMSLPELSSTDGELGSRMR
jgi:hypothetical protein